MTADLVEAPYTLNASRRMRIVHFSPITDSARWIRIAGLFVEADRLGMTALVDLVDTGQLTPTIAATYPLEQAGTAQDTKSGPSRTVLTLP